MRKFLALAFAAALSGCAGAPGGMITPAIDKATPQSEATWRDHAKKSDREDEARALKAFPQLARREGVDLYIFRDGKVLAKKTSDPQNCQGWNTCRLWYFHDGIRLINARTGQLETFAQLDFHHGEGGNGVIIDDQGKDFDISELGKASPDGRFIATGTDCSDCEAYLTVYDWTGAQKPAEFEIACLPVAWRDARSFSARCEFTDDNDFISADAEVTQSGDGKWHLRETRAVKHDTGAAIAGRPLKTWTASIQQ